MIRRSVSLNVFFNGLRFPDDSAQKNMHGIVFSECEEGVKKTSADSQRGLELHRGRSTFKQTVVKC